MLHRVGCQPFDGVEVNVEPRPSVLVDLVHLLDCILNILRHLVDGDLTLFKICKSYHTRPPQVLEQFLDRRFLIIILDILRLVSSLILAFLVLIRVEELGPQVCDLLQHLP